VLGVWCSDDPREYQCCFQSACLQPLGVLGGMGVGVGVGIVGSDRVVVVEEGRREEGRRQHHPWWWSC
jgi:hypothetical protein